MMRPLTAVARPELIQRFVAISTKSLGPNLGWLAHALDEYESKKDRYVRTLSGARRYGKPIGSLITAEDRKRVGKPRRIERALRPAAVMSGRPIGDEKNGQIIDLHQHAYKNYVATGTKYQKELLNYGTVTKIGEGYEFNGTDKYGEDMRSADYISIRPAMLSSKAGQTSAKYVAEIWDDASSTFGPRYLYHDDLDTLRESTSKLYVNRRKRLSGKQNGEDYEGQWGRNRGKGKGKDSVMGDSWTGVRGRDWWKDSGEKFKPEDIAYRRALADTDAASMGLKFFHKYNGYPGVGDGDLGGNFSPAVMEQVNALFRAHEARYPGFTGLFAGTRLDSYNGALAYNLTAEHDVKITDKENGSSAYHTKVLTTLAMNPKLFSSSESLNAKARAEAIFKGKANSPRDRLAFWSSDMGALAKKHNLTPLEALTITTMTHEMGHTVGFILQNRLNYNGERVDRINNDGDPNLSTGNWFREDFIDILRSYGILYSDRDLGEIRDQDMEIMAGGKVGDFQDRWRGVIDREALAEHLSVYGATNMSELFAEVWTSYQLDDDPTDFVKNVGDLMEEALEQFLDWDYDQFDGDRSNWTQRKSKI